MDLAMSTPPNGIHIIPDDHDHATAPTSNCSTNQNIQAHVVSCTHSTKQPCQSPHHHAANHNSHTALHGNAFNPDMGEIAEYGTLSCSSDGTHWQATNVAEIHQLAQGTSTSPRTNTMNCIPVTALPVGHKATYLHIICAH